MRTASGGASRAILSAGSQLTAAESSLRPTPPSARQLPLPCQAPGELSKPRESAQGSRQVGKALLPRPPWPLRAWPARGPPTKPLFQEAPPPSLPLLPRPWTQHSWPRRPAPELLGPAPRFKAAATTSPRGQGHGRGQKPALRGGGGGTGGRAGARVPGDSGRRSRPEVASAEGRQAIGLFLSVSPEQLQIST